MYNRSNTGCNDTSQLPSTRIPEQDARASKWWHILVKSRSTYSDHQVRRLDSITIKCFTNWFFVQHAWRNLRKQVHELKNLKVLPCCSRKLLFQSTATQMARSASRKEKHSGGRSLRLPQKLSMIRENIRENEKRTWKRSQIKHCRFLSPMRQSNFQFFPLCSIAKP